MIIRGRCWKFGDNVSTDHIISGKYKFEAIDSLERMLPHLFGELIPNFYAQVRPGDIIIAGRNFGKGSSREHAARLIKMAGIAAVVAKSFSHIFFRNAINIGLPVVVSKTIPDASENGDIIEIDLSAGVVRNLTKGVEERVSPYPDVVKRAIAAGGLLEYIKRYGAPPW